MLLARWITPPAYPYRYDTYFYGAIVNNNSDNNNSNSNEEYSNLSNNQLDGMSCTKYTHAQQIAL